MKPLTHFYSVLLLALFLAGCGGSGSGGTHSSAQESSASSSTAVSSESSSSEATSSAEIAILLEGDAIVCDSSAVTVSDNVATITRSGSYRISGTLSDGRIIVDTDGDVTLTLGGVDIFSSTNAPLSVMGAENTVIVLEAGSVNTLIDAADYIFDDPDDDEPNAALFSKDDLLITGSGTLKITARYNDAIASKDTLTIESGTFAIDAADDAIRGKEGLFISGGSFTLNAYGDVLKADDDDEGNLHITAGTFNLTSFEGDAIAAERNATISGGSFNLHTASGYQTYLDDDSSSMKCIKAGIALNISGGTFDLNCADDALHANDTLLVSGGTFDIATGDDALHSDISLQIDGGTLRIAHSYEGVEGGTIVINDGSLHINSDDDGLNAASDDVATPSLTINGGTVVVESSGDGIDVNGLMTMNGGTVIVHGPVANDNGALDYDMQFRLNGGTLIAVGSSRMAQAPSSVSTQPSISVTFSSVQSAETLLHLQDSSGTSLLTFAPKKAYQSLIYSSSALIQGNSYDLYLGGSASDPEESGRYLGAYTPGSLYTTLTLTGSVTSVGNTGGMTGH